jgi:hypothetical protein
MPKPDIQEMFDKAMASQSSLGRAMKAVLKAKTGMTEWLVNLKVVEEMG